MRSDASGEASELFVGRCLQIKRLGAEAVTCRSWIGGFERRQSCGVTSGAFPARASSTERKRCVSRTGSAGRRPVYSREGNEHADDGKTRRLPALGISLPMLGKSHSLEVSSAIPPLH